MDKRIQKNRKDESGVSARRLWFRSDLIVITALLLVAALSYLVYTSIFARDSGSYCEIVLDGEIIMTVELDKDKIFSTAQKPDVVFETKNGAIAFIQSDCPDKVCINSGFLHQAGQRAACLPNRIAIRIRTENSGDSPDAVI